MFFLPWKRCKNKVLELCMNNYVFLFFFNLFCCCEGYIYGGFK